MIVRQRVLQRLQTFHSLAKRRSLVLSRTEHTKSKESFHSEKLIVVGFVRTNLGIEVFEATSDPRCISGFIVVRQQITSPVAQEPCKFFIVLLDRVGSFI